MTGNLNRLCRFAKMIFNKLPLPTSIKQPLGNWGQGIFNSWKARPTKIDPIPKEDIKVEKQSQPNNSTTNSNEEINQPEPPIVSDRKTKLLSRISPPDQNGLEIGPLCFPAVTKGESNNHIFYMDYLSTEGLREKYKTEPSVDVSNIVEIDFICGDRPLPEIVNNIQFDYVIASHVIEHVPDMIGWLDEIAEILNDKGVLALAIPDKRFSFDHLRELSSAGMIIESYLTHRRRPSPSSVFDQIALGSKPDIFSAWDGTLDQENIHSFGPLQSAYDVALDCASTDNYHDVHVNVFTPMSFINILEIISQLNLFQFTISDFFTTSRNTLEFFVSLERIPRVIKGQEKLDLQLASINWAKSRAQ